MRAILLSAFACCSPIALPPLQAAPRHEEPPKGDAGLETLAREALDSADAAFRKQILAQLKGHTFKSSKSPQKEYCLFAQGLLEDSLGEEEAAAATLRKLELGFSKSAYLPEAQVILAAEALRQGRAKEAEGRLQKAISQDLPHVGKRRAQDLLLFALVELGRPEEGLDLVSGLADPGNRKPTEMGAAALAIVLCQSGHRDRAESTVKDYQRRFPKGEYNPRVHVAWARLLGSLGEARASADALRKVIREFPKAPATDEARLALATLLSEGKLSSRYAKNLPDAESLLQEMKETDLATEAGRKRELIRLRLTIRKGQWRSALTMATNLEGAHPSASEKQVVADLRAEAFRTWTADALAKKRPSQLLPELTRPHVEALAPDSRLRLAQALAQGGLPEAAQAVRSFAPAGEQGALGQAILKATIPEAHPDTTIALSPTKGATPETRLRLAQALAAKGDWNALRAQLDGALPGPERIAVALSYLRRPLVRGEADGYRVREAEGLLGRAKEKGTIREPLAICVADLRARGGDWKGALALYPEKPADPFRAWVGLMRATALARTGKRDQAKSQLQAVKDLPEFKTERTALGRQLGME